MVSAEVSLHSSTRVLTASLSSLIYGINMGIITAANVLFGKFLWSDSGEDKAKKSGLSMVLFRKNFLRVVLL